MKLKLYPEEAYVWQKKAHEIVAKNVEQIVVIKAARQLYGKTHFCIAELLKTCIQNPGVACAYISPTLNLAIENYKRIASKCKPIIAQTNAVRGQIIFTNHSKISFFSAAQKNSLRGFNCSGLLVVDEAAYIPDVTWTELVAPWTLKHKPTVIMISTPFFREGFFYTNFNSKSNVVLDWVEDYPQPETPFLIELKSTMPLRRYNCEYRGQWLEADGAVFQNFNDILIEQKDPQKNEKLFVGIDWASGAGKDSTVLVAFDEENEMRLLRTWTDVAPMKQIEEIKSILHPIVRSGGVIYAESNSLGSVYLDALRAEIPVNSFLTTNQSKRRIIDNLRVMMEQKQVKLINDRELVSQFVFFEESKLHGGGVSYEAAKGKHDDIVMATAIALHAATAKPLNYSII